MAIKISDFVRAHIAYALATQAKYFPGLSAGRNLEAGASVECGDLHITAQR